MAKTPSPKVIASYLLREAFTNVPNNTTAEALSTLVDSRVSEDKKAKVLDQFAKITAKLAERVQKTIDKFNDVAPLKKAVKKDAVKAKKQDDEDDDKPKKKKKKKDR